MQQVGEAAILYAAWNGQLEIVTLLIINGCDVNICDKVSYSFCTYHINLTIREESIYCAALCGKLWTFRYSFIINKLWM